MAIRYETFCRRYQPVMDMTGETLQQFDFHDPILASQPPEHIWTMLDCDGKMRIVNGWHRVNRMYYVLTKLPWTDPDIEVLY